MAKKKSNVTSPKRTAKKSAKALTETQKLGQASTQVMSKRKSSAGQEKLPEEVRQGIELLSGVEEHVSAMQKELSAEFQQSLNSLAGKTFESKPLNAEIAQRIQAMCNSLRVRILSPKGRPATLRWRDFKSTRNGAFELRAQVDGRQKTDYFGTRLPAEMQLVPLDE